MAIEERPRKLRLTGCNECDSRRLYELDDDYICLRCRTLRGALDRIADLESCIVWLVDNADIRVEPLSGDPEIAWPGFDLIGDMTVDQIVEAVKRAKEESDANRR